MDTITIAELWQNCKYFKPNRRKSKVNFQIHRCELCAAQEIFRAGKQVHTQSKKFDLPP